MTPTANELILLKALWKHKVLSARELHDIAGPELGWSFSSTRKTIERMIEKEIVQNDEAHGMKVYRPAVGKLQTIAAMTRDFATKVFEIDGPLPVTAFSDSKLLSEEELSELEGILDGEDTK